MPDSIVWKCSFGHIEYTRLCVSCSANKGRLPKEVRIEILEKTLEGIYGEYYEIPKLKDSSHKSIASMICKKHGPFSRMVSDFLRGSHCSGCKKEGVSIGYRLGRNGNLSTDFSNPIHCICKEHGHLTIYGDVLYRFKSGVKICQKCDDFKSELAIKRENNFIKIVSDRFENLTVKPGTFTNIQNDVTFICNKHGEFIAKGRVYTRMQPCDKCSNKFRSSRKEIQWLDLLGVKDRQYKIPGKNYNVDGFDPIEGIIYEFLGDYWHGNSTIYDENKPSTKTLNSKGLYTMGDLNKWTFDRINEMTDLGYKVCYIWESDYDNGFISSKTNSPSKRVGSKNYSVNKEILDGTIYIYNGEKFEESKYHGKCDQVMKWNPDGFAWDDEFGDRYIELGRNVTPSGSWDDVWGKG